MTVFKTYLKILNKNKFIVIMYTAILLVFGGFSLQTNETSMNFEASKPDLYIINLDENKGITKDLIHYLSLHSTIKELDSNEESLNDALFYRDVNYIVTIPKNFRNDFLTHKNPSIEVKSTGDYQSSLASMMLERYLSVANTYLELDSNEENLIKNIGDTLASEVEIELTSKLDVNSLSKATNFYNFSNYSMLAGCVYVICFILSSFKEEKIEKRTRISSMNYKKHNRLLLLSNGLFAFTLFLLYIALSFILVGKVMFTMQGLLYIFNFFLFTIASLCLAFFLASLIHNKNAINGLVNVIALGSSFLCGAFVPMEWLPKVVLNIAHVLPSYYYIYSNELLKSVEVFDFINLKPIVINMLVLVLFGILFVILTNIVSKRKLG